MIESYALVPHVVCNINENKFLSAYARVLAVTLHRDETRLGHFRFHPKIMGERLGFKACTMAKAFKELLRIGFCVAEEVRMIGKMTTESTFQGNHVRFTYWRLKNIAFPSIVHRTLIEEHRKGVEAALSALS